MTTLNRDQILEANDLTLESVDVPEWGGSVMVRAMTGADRDAFDASNVKEVDGKLVSDYTNLCVKLVARTIVDEAGNRIFSDDDMSALGRKSAAALDRVYRVAQRLNMVGAQGAAEAGKNSASGQSSDSGTDSPATSENPSGSASAT